MDGPLLSLALESPLYNLVGFEHAPRSPEQQEAVARMMATLNAPADLFNPTAAAACSPVRITIESPFLAESDDHDHGHDHRHGHEHADLYAEYDFHCDSPAELRGLQLELFARFPGIEHIHAELAVPGGQSAARLDAGQRELRWR